MQPLKFEDWLKTVNHPREIVAWQFDNDTYGLDLDTRNNLFNIVDCFKPQDIETDTAGDFRQHFENLADKSAVASARIFEDAAREGYSDVRIRVEFEDDIPWVKVFFNRPETDAEYHWRLEDTLYKKYVDSFTQKSNQMNNLVREKERLETLLNSRKDLEASIRELTDKIKGIEDDLNGTAG